MTGDELKVGAKMERELKAYVQSALTDLASQQAGPVNRSTGSPAAASARVETGALHD